MSNPVPSSLALTTIPDGSPRTAAPVRNNFTSVQSAVNAIITILSGGTVGQVLTAADASDVQWADAATRYTKTTAKAVNTTVGATDLLNAEITLAAGVMGTVKPLRAVLFGDLLNNTAGARTPPRLQLVVGGTTVFDTGASGTFSFSASRARWSCVIDMLELGSASAQEWSMRFRLTASPSGSATTAPSNVFTTGIGRYDSTGSTGIYTAEGGNTTTINTAGSLAFVFNVINGFSDANYETRLNGGYVQIG